MKIYNRLRLLNSAIFIFAVVYFLGLTSCGTLNKNNMFKTEGEVINDTILNAISNAEKNYIVKKNDYLDISVFTNKGERIVDPNQEMSKQLGSGSMAISSNGADKIKFLVETNGEVKLPLLGYLKVEGYTLRKLDSLLQTKYSEFYNETFVLTKVLNKRVFVLGNAGSKSDLMAKVIPLENENMTLIEVLTLAGGLDHLAKSNKIRLIRGDLKNPNVYLIDLSTIEGVRKSHLNIQPNDIVYVERQRKVLSQFLTEVLPVISLLNTILLLYVVSKTRL
jgi:polysaccharide biosynthesis/export protein